MFSKTNVPIGYKAVLKIDAQVSYEWGVWSVIPGPAALIASRLLSVTPAITVDVDGEAKSTAALSLSTDAGVDKFDTIV